MIENISTTNDFSDDIPPRAAWSGRAKPLPEPRITVAAIHDGPDLNTGDSARLAVSGHRWLRRPN